MNAEDAITAHVDDITRLKYYAARRIWPIRFETTPNSGEKWCDWFKRMYHEDLEEYSHRANREQIGNRVRLYEENRRSA